MKRVLFIASFLILVSSSYVSATCRDGILAYGDSCENDFDVSDGRIIYAFFGEAGDHVIVTLTWEDEAQGHMFVVGPQIMVSEPPPPLLNETVEGSDNLLLLENIDLPEDGMYAIGVSFDAYVTYNVLLESADASRNNQVRPESVFDTSVILYAEGSPDSFVYDLFILTARSNRSLVRTDSDMNYCGDISADGTMVVFSSSRDNSSASMGLYGEIYTMPIDGSEAQRLTDESETDEFMPRWSPDGARIVFTVIDPVSFVRSAEIYIMDADGTNLQQLTDNDVADRDPAWSPDGQHLIFTSLRDGNAELYQMNPEGSDVQRLTNTEWNEFRASYSPDGSHILFSADPDDRSDLFVMSLDGTIERLTDSENRETSAVWSPDGMFIAYTHDLNTGTISSEIWMMNADGSDQVPLHSARGLDLTVCDWGVLAD